ncbi:hypothetical protein GCM10009128_02750 [Psychrosphaera haliotis]
MENIKRDNVAFMSRVRVPITILGMIINEKVGASIRFVAIEESEIPPKIVIVIGDIQTTINT